MSRKALLAIMLLLIFALGLSSCDPTPTPLPPCAPGSLVAPDLVSPDWREVMDGSAVVLEWSYPDPCQPDEYEIILAKDLELTMIEITDLVSGSANNYSPPTLDIAEEYWWRVFAKVGSTKGPPSIERRSFFTEPICDPGDLVAPSLSLPINGGIFYKSWSSLEWEWPLTTCIPAGYRVRVAPDPGFTDSTYFGHVPNPATRWGFGPIPPDATQFWWKIIPYVSGVDGPESLTFTFHTDPVCAVASLVAPDLLTPLDGETVMIGNPEFTWSYPHLCSPEGFHLQISSTPDMSTIVLNADNPDRAFRSFQAGIPLDNCDSYFWRVAQVSEGVEGPWSEVREFFIDTDGTCACDPGSIPVPELLRPGLFEVIPDFHASLHWYNPGDCFPDGWTIKLGKNTDYEDPSLFGAVPSHSDTSWGAGPLDPVEQYHWKVAGVVDSPPDTIIGAYSLPSMGFFTGPECATLADLSAPTLIAPADGAVVDTTYPILEIDYGDPGCLPDGLFYNLQTDPAFAGTNLLGDFHHPWNRVTPGDPVTDCTLYYWYAAFIQDGGYGPDSEIRSFYVNESGDCPAMPVPGIFKMNAFCRFGTFPKVWPDALYLFMEGDPVQVIARNFFKTYLQVYIPPPEGEEPKPMAEMESCWTLYNAIRFKFPEQEPELPIVNPPPTPKPTDTPEPVTCHAKLSYNDCLAAGGSWDTGQNLCDCP